MKLGKKLFLFIIMILLLVFVTNSVSADNCGGAIQCDCADILAENHTMWYDLTNCTGNGLVIGSNEIVTLDCNGHLIDGIGSSFGVYLNSNEEIIIKNCNIQEFELGIFLNYGNNNNFVNNVITDNSYGIGVFYGLNNNLNNNNINNSQYEGIFVEYYSSNNNIFNNTITNSGLEGIYVSGSSNYNNIFSNTIINGVNNGIFLNAQSHYNNIYENDISGNGNGILFTENSEANTLWNNFFVDNDINAYENPGIVNLWNITNLGNYWDDFETNPGYPNYYEIPGSGAGIDWYPIWNSPPIIEPIEDITVYETELVTIEVIATDPGNDTLTYSINDSRFEQNENIFTWQTTYTDAGDYVFLVTVSDGWNNIDVEANVFVIDVPIEYFIDNSDPEFTIVSGDWNSRNFPNAYNEESVYNGDGYGLEVAGWGVNNVVEPSSYDVYVWKFEHNYSSRMGRNVHYMVYHRTGTSNWITVDQSTPGNEWVFLRNFEFDNSHDQGIMITDESNGKVIADTIKLVYTGPLSSLDSGGPDLFDYPI